MKIGDLVEYSGWVHWPGPNGTKSKGFLTAKANFLILVSSDLHHEYRPKALNLQTNKIYWLGLSKELGYQMTLLQSSSP